MSHFDEILNQGKTKEEDKVQQTEAKDKPAWMQKREALFEMIEDVCPTIVTSTQEMTEFLTVLSRFEKYSLKNNILIYAQRADATKIKDYQGWKDEGGFVKKGSKSFMILEPSPYTKDGEPRVSFHAKTVFDASDVTGITSPPQTSYDKAMLIRALVNDSPVDIKTVKDYPADQPEGAYYHVKDHCIYAKAGMEVCDIFLSVSQALACAEMERVSDEPFRVANHMFQARCVAFVLATKYGVPTDKVSLYSMPNRYATYNCEQIQKELSEIHGAVKVISGRMNQILQERLPATNKSRSDKEAR